MKERKKKLTGTGMYAVVKSVATLFSLIFFIDRAGRRKLLIVSSIGTSLALWYIGGFVTAAHVDTTKPQGKTVAGWIAIVCIYLYAVRSPSPLNFLLYCLTNIILAGILLLCLERRCLGLLRRDLPHAHQRASRVPDGLHAVALAVCHRTRLTFHAQ